MKLKIKEEKIPYVILAGFLCLWMALAAIAIHEACGPLILPDEFGYWGQAANMAGMDWHEAVSKYSWYSFGFGFLMLPFMKLVPNPIAAYRVLTGINFLLLGISPLLVYQTLLRICGGQNKKRLAAISGAAMLYVSYLTYAHTTMAESLLTFLYVLLAYGLCRWFSRKSVGNLVLVLLAAGYMYTVHMRTIGILLATAVLLCLSTFWDGKKKAREKVVWIMLVIICVVLIVVLQNVGKTRLISSVGSETYSAMTQANDYAGQLGKIRFLFSLKGIGYFLAGFFGKVFYLGCATFGLYYWGMAYLLKKAKELFGCLKRKEAYYKESWLYIWLLLSHVAALLITSVYCVRTSRLDGILYGRYHENTLPFITAFGVVALLAQPKGKKRILWLIVLSSTSFFFIYMLLGTGQIMYTNRHSITGVLYALVFADFYDSKSILYAYFGAVLGGMLLIGLSALKGVWQRWLLVGIMGLQLTVAAFSIHFLIRPVNENQREDIEGIWQAKQLADKRNVEKFCYLYRGATKDICTVQYTLWDISLHLVSEEELLDTLPEAALEEELPNVLPEAALEEQKRTEKEAFVIVPAGDELAERLSLYYTGVIRTPHYEIYFKE